MLVNRKFINQLIRGQKKLLREKNVKKFFIPHPIKGIILKELWEKVEE